MLTVDRRLATDQQQLATPTVFGRAVSFFRTWSTSRTKYPLGYIAALDGTRGLMTLGVMLAHTRMALFGGAVVYMDVFFVASGYLITSLLIAEYGKRETIDLKKFYVRRLSRLYPALIVMIAVMLALSAVLSSEFELRLTEAVVALTYLTDYWRAFGGPGIWYTNHMWSLAVEEQFYLLWPAAFILLARRFGVSWTTVAIVFAGALGFALWRMWLTYEGASIARLYDSFDTRADALLAGCGLALVLRKIDWAKHPRLAGFLANSLAPIALFMLALGFTANSNLRWYYYVSPLLGTIPGLIGIAGLVQPRRTFMHALYEQPFAVFCGRICYGLYIWHLPVFSVIGDYLGDMRSRYVIIVLVAWPITFALATASYYLVERHFMRTRPL